AFYCAFINNIIIASNIAEEYLKYLDLIFSLFISKNISISLKKLFISYPSVKLLGFWVNI
ncbi:hypothetical protein OFC47_27600, partial [Escherichia coli]|nr:hypothetical protein [Escherichia coli]